MMIVTEFSRVNCLFFEQGVMGENVVQTGTFDLQARFETRFSVSHWLNQHKLVKLWFVDTFDQSQTSIQHNNPY